MASAEKSVRIGADGAFTMRVSIDKKAGESAYLQLYHQIKNDIVAGLLPEGTKLPSKRLMAEELGISVITVEHSYALLADEGYIEALPRSGFYVSFDAEGKDYAENGGGSAESMLPELPDPPEPITEAPEDFPFTVLSRVMRNVLSDRGREILQKSPNSGVSELRETIAGYLLRTRGIRVSPLQIVIGSGAEYLYGLVVQLLGRDRAYATEDPCYEKIREVYRRNGVEPSGLPMGKHGIHSLALQNCSADVLHVTPWDSYPSGVSASASKRHAYIQWASLSDRLIVEDDYGSEFASPTRQIETLFSLAPDRVIYINTFTKTMAPSMRMGYMLLPEKLVPLFHEKLGFYACTVPVFEQYVLEEFIREGHLERYINQRRRKMRQEK